MRSSIQCCAAVAIGLLASTSARACDPVVTECLRPVTLYPAYTPEGLRVGTVVARVRLPLRLERSRFTGQPITVVYNEPGRFPESIDPEIALVPLPHVARSHTEAVYPRGY